MTFEFWMRSRLSSISIGAVRGSNALRSMSSREK